MALFSNPQAVYPQKNTKHGLLEVRIFEGLSSPKKKTHCFKNNWEKESSLAVRCAIYIKDPIFFFLGSCPKEIYFIWSLIYFSFSTRNVLWKWKISLSYGPCNSKAKFWRGFKDTIEKDNERFGWQGCGERLRKHQFFFLRRQVWEVLRVMEGYHICVAFLARVSQSKRSFGNSTRGSSQIPERTSWQ